MSLEKEFKYYLDHQDELVKKHNGRFIVIHADQVLGDYATELEAYTEGKKKFDLGTFLIQKVSPGQSSYTQSFHSRVSYR